MAGIIYIHFNYRSPEYVNIRKPSYVAPDDRVDIVGYREELLESVSKYRDEWITQLTGQQSKPIKKTIPWNTINHLFV